MSIDYDLHSHSRASDGTLTPTELVRRARAQGVGALALTDHDVTDGLAEAAREAAALGLQLVPGVEVSVTWNHQTVHIVGLNIDPGEPALAAGLARLQEFRQWRCEEIARRLEKRGIGGALEGARALATGSVVSRTHFARFLVAQGRAESVRDVFKRYLVHGKPGHVPGQWAPLEEAVGWIRGSGGQAVLAHPARYRLTATRRRQLAGEFRECGGEGIEVVSGSHSRDDVANMAQLARRIGLYASRGSDYHGPEQPYIELGRLPPLPEGCQPIWESPGWGSAVCADSRAVPSPSLGLA